MFNYPSLYIFKDYFSIKTKRRKMPTSIVTGGAGFIGSHLCEALIRKGHKVICFDNLSTGSLKNIQNLNNNLNFKFIKGDVIKKSEIEKAFSENIDYVFHYAATVGVKRTLENPLLVLDDIDGMRNILELSRIKDAKKVVFSSSSEVYGDPVEFPESEESHTNAKLPYAVTKLMSEKYMQAYHKLYNLPTVSLRLFNVYGPKQESTPYGFVVGIFIKSILNNMKIPIFGDGSQTRDFVFIQDNINATLKCLETEKCNGEVINIGTGKPTSIIDLAETVARVLKKEKIEFEFLPTREYEIKHRFPDITKMKRILDYKHIFSIEEGLRETISWFKFNQFNGLLNQSSS